MEPEPEPEPELQSQLALPDTWLPPVVAADAAAITASARARAAAGHLQAARHHIEAARAADRHNMGGPQYALAIQSLESALRVDPDAEWEDGRHASEVLEEARGQLGERQQERDDATVAAATASAAGGMLERAFGSASSWLQLSGWTAGSRFASEPCELNIPPASPVRGSLAITWSCLEFQPLAKVAARQTAKSANRAKAASFKRLWSGAGDDGRPGQALTIPLANIVNCFERSDSAHPGLRANGSRHAAMPPPVALPPTDAEQSEDETPSVPHGYIEAPEEQRTVVVTYSVGLQGSAAHHEASLTLTACAAENLLGILEPIVERYHAERAGSGSTVDRSSDTHIVYERAYFQCQVDGQGALDSGALHVDLKTSSRGQGCVVTFEGSFHRVSILLGIIPDALGGSVAGELLHVRVRDDVPEVRGRQTVHVVHQPPGARDSLTVEWLLEQHEATRLCAQLSPYVGPFTQVQERFVTTSAKHARAKEVSASVGSLLEAVPPILDAARNHGEEGRYAIASTMLTLEMLKMHYVIEEWRSLGHESSAGAAFEYESSEEKEFEALGYLFSSCGTLEAQFSVQGRQRMQVWGMLSEQDAYVSDVWRQGFYVLDGGVVSRYTPWESAPEESFTLASVLGVDHVTSTRKSALELVATLGLDGMSNELPEHVLAITRVHLPAPDIFDGVIGAAASLLVGDDHLGNISAEEETAVGVGRELTQRTNELFARVSDDGDWTVETRAEAMRLSQSHLEFGESNAVSAASADRYGLGGAQWELASDAFRNALRLRPSDDRWSEGREDGSASRALVEAEAGAASSARAPRVRAEASTASTTAPVKRFLQAPDEASFDIWRSALTPISTDVFAVQSFPVEELSLHLYRVDRTGGGGRGHWGGGGVGKQKLSPSRSGARPPREDRGWTTRHCRLFPSTICFHEEQAGKLGLPIGAGVDLWQVVKGSVHIVPAASAPREHYGRVGAVLSMVVVVPPSDDGNGNFSSGKCREVCLASSDEVAIAQWERAVIDQLEKRPELPTGDDTRAMVPTELHTPTLEAPCIGSAGSEAAEHDDDEDDWYEDDELIAIAT